MKILMYRTKKCASSRPLDPDPVLSPMMVSWLISGLTLVVTIIIIIIMVKVLRNKEKKPSELERETRTCQSLHFFQHEPQ